MILSIYLTTRNVPHVAVASDVIVDSDGNHIADTDAFRSWFAGSKVVDTDGKPLVVHHGSHRPITNFKQMPNEDVVGVSRGFYFTPDEEAAGQYGSMTQSYYLKAARLVSLPAKMSYKQASKLLTLLGIDTDQFDRLLNNVGRRHGFVRPFHLLKDGDSDWGGEDLQIGSLVLEALRRRGVDCVTFDEAYFDNDRASARTYCVFDANQIRPIADFVESKETSSEYGLQSGYTVKTEYGMEIPMEHGIKGTVPVRVVKNAGKFRVFLSDVPVTDHERGRTYHPTSGAGNELQIAVASDFDSWFSGSKVVDAHGKPLKVYHGCRSASGLVGEPRTNGLGMFFTDSYDFAESYHEGCSANEGKPYAAFLSIKHPLVIDAQNQSWDEIEYTDEIKAVVSKSGLRFDPYELDVGEDEPFLAIDMDTLAKVTKAAGYDGLMVHNLVSTIAEKYSEIVAFHSEQIRICK